MSRASQWAADVKRREAEVERLTKELENAENAIPRPAWFAVPRSNGVRNDAPHVIGRVRPDGDCAIGSTSHGSGQQLSPTEAIAFAHWILDTFSDPDAKE